MAEAQDLGGETQSKRLMALFPHRFTLQYYGPNDLLFPVEVSDILRVKDQLLAAVKRIQPLENPETLTGIENFFLLRKLSRFEPELHLIGRDQEIFCDIVHTAKKKIAGVNPGRVFEAISLHAQEVFDPHVGTDMENWELRRTAIAFLEEYPTFLTEAQLERLLPHIANEILVRYDAFRKRFEEYPRLFEQAMALMAEQNDIRDDIAIVDDVLKKSVRTTALREASLKALDRIIESVREFVDSTGLSPEDSNDLFRAELYTRIIAEICIQLKDSRTDEFVEKHAKIYNSLSELIQQAGFVIPIGRYASDRFRNFKNGIASPDGEIPASLQLVLYPVRKANEKHAFTSRLNLSDETCVTNGEIGSTEKSLPESTEPEINQAVFELILGDTESLKALQKFFHKTRACIAEGTAFTEEKIVEWVDELYHSMAALQRRLSRPLHEPTDTFAQCYGQAMFLCALTERLLNGVYTKRKPPPKGKENSKEAKMYRQKLKLSVYLNSAAAENPLRNLLWRNQFNFYSLTLRGETREEQNNSSGPSLRNDMAHLNLVLSPEMVTPSTVALLLYLFTDLWSTLVMEGLKRWAPPPAQA